LEYEWLDGQQVSQCFIVHRHYGFTFISFSLFCVCGCCVAFVLLIARPVVGWAMAVYKQWPGSNWFVCRGRLITGPDATFFIGAFAAVLFVSGVFFLTYVVVYIDCALLLHLRL
jgi:hypothetical protein